MNSWTDMNGWTWATMSAGALVLVRLACAFNGMDHSTPQAVRHGLLLLLIGAGTYTIAPSWGHRFDWLDFTFMASVAAALWADRRHHSRIPG